MQASINMKLGNLITLYSIRITFLVVASYLANLVLHNVLKFSEL